MFMEIIEAVGKLFLKAFVLALFTNTAGAILLAVGAYLIKKGLP